MKKHTVLLAIIACLLWGSVFPFVKIGLTYLPPFTLAGLRFITAGLLLVPLCFPYKQSIKEVKTHYKFIFLVSLFQTAYLYGSFFLGMSMVRGAQTAMIIGSSPIVAAFMAHFLMKNDLMSLKKALFQLVGFIGIVIISIASQPWTDAGMKEFIGILILFSGTLVSIYANILIAKNSGRMNPITLNSGQMMTGGAILLIFGLAREGVPNLALPATFYMVFFWLSFVSAVGFSIWIWALQHTKVSELNMWKFLIPCVGAVSSWIILKKESPDIFSIAGLLLIIFAVIALSRVPSKQAGSLSQS